MSVSKYDPDCTNRCRSSQHGDILTSLLTLRSLTEEEMAAYMRTICSNYCHVVDKSGRTAVHMAASCGHSKIIKWLSQHKECNINAKDIESGFTPLHRSLYCGQIHAAICLMQLGANTSALDNDNLMPLEHVMKDRICYGLLFPVEASISQCEVYIWGTNTNFTLGTGMQHNRQLPELLEPFRKQNISIKQVVMHKFHSVFVSCDGHVYSCGHGQGGRLGLKTEQAVLTPCRVKFATPPNTPAETCTMASISRDHTLLLTDSGNVWTCGLNSHHQLGHAPPPKFFLSPQSLPLRSLKPVGSIMGICAARFHSVIWGPQGILTFGLHAGQLGHTRNSDKENTIIKPKIVSALNLRDGQITEVAASDGATVVVTKRGEIFVLHEYQCRKIASRQTDVRKVVVVGGHLDPRLDKENLMDRGGEKLKVLVLTKRGELMLWQEESPQLTRCVFNLNRFIRVKDVAMNRSHLLFVTWDSEAFQGEVKQKKTKKSPSEQSPKTSSHPLLEKKDCEIITVTRIPHAHRAVSITSDMKGRNFALLQVHPREALAPDVVPSLQERSTMREQMNNLLLEANEDDAIHDIIFEVGPRNFPAHRLMVVSRSKYLEKLIAEQEAIFGHQDVVRVRLNDVEPDVFQNMLKYMYTNQCKLNTPATLQTANTKPVEVFLECSDGKNVDTGVVTPESPELVSAYSVYSARSKYKKKTKPQIPDNLYNIKTSILSSAKQSWKKYGLPDFNVTDKNLSILEPPSLPKWNRTEHENLCNVLIRCENNMELQAHKSILAARLEYFHSMLSRGWRETARGTTTLTLPLPYNILKILIDYLYQDEVSLEGKDSDDLELLTNLLVLADQLFVERLKEMCEMLLTKLITLRNAAELLQFAETYNAKHLKKFCMEYITVNMCAILEARTLERVSSEVLDELTSYYRQWCPSMCFRIITPYSTAPTPETVKEAYESNPIIFDSEDSIPLFDCVNNKRAIKQAKRKARVRQTSTDDGRTDSRTRKESNSSVGSDDFDHNIKSVSFGDLVEKSPQNLEGGVTIPHKENIDKNSQWIKISPSNKQSKILQARLKAISASKESSFLTESLQESFTTLNRSSPSSPVNTQSQLGVQNAAVLNPIKIINAAVPNEEITLANGTPPQTMTLLDFPALCSSPTGSGIVQYHHKIEKMSPKVVETKKPVKLSQKQRKRLTSISDIGLMGDHLDTLNQSPPPPAWGRTSPEIDISFVNLTLADIMRQELHQTRSSPIVIPKRPIVLLEDSARKPTRSITNPWAKIDTPETSMPKRDEEQMSFTKILADEKKSKDNLTKMLSKSLELTQIEDQAISDLLQFYNASKATEERITVQRVIIGPIAAPTWITNR